MRERFFSIRVQSALMSLKELFALLQDKFGVPNRIDLAAFSRIKRPDAAALYSQNVGLPLVRGMTLGNALNDILAQLSQGDGATGELLTCRVRKGQIAIVPAFKPQILSVGVPPSDQIELPGITMTELMEQDEGGPVSLSVEERSLLDVLREMRESKGVNIVLDARHKDKAKQTVSATLHDVRLMAALHVLGDMCELQPVSLNNVFYVTSKENAEKLQKEIDRRRYGDPNSASGMGGRCSWRWRSGSGRAGRARHRRSSPSACKSEQAKFQRRLKTPSSKTKGRPGSCSPCERRSWSSFCLRTWCFRLKREKSRTKT